MRDRFVDEVGIEHGGRDIGMSQCLLHQADIGSGPVEIRGKRVTQQVGMHVFTNSRFVGAPLNHLSQVAVVDGSTFEGGKEPLTGYRTAGLPGPEQLQIRVIEPYGTVFLAFPLPHHQLPTDPIYVTHAYIEGFRGPQAGVEHEREQTPVTVTGGGAQPGGSEQGVTLGSREHIGQFTRTSHGEMFL